jgi:hypothetical protein
MIILRLLLAEISWVIFCIVGRQSHAVISYRSLLHGTSKQ